MLQYYNTDTMDIQNYKLQNYEATELQSSIQYYRTTNPRNHETTQLQSYITTKLQN